MPPSDDAPHRHPDSFARLLDELEIPVILVAIASWMGSRLRQQCTAEDLWQETLAMAWRDRDKHEWHGLRAYRAWLLGIARNRVHDAADHAHTKKRGGGQPAQAFSDLAASDDGSISHLLPPGSTTPSRAAWHRERALLIERALHELPPELEAIVRLRLVEELPMREVAARAGIGVTTANERFFRGAAIYRVNLERLLAGSDGQVSP